MFGTIHERLDLSLRSPRNPISLGVVVGASVPSSIFLGCHGRCLTGTYCHRRPAESSDSHCRFPDSFPRTLRLVEEVFVVHKGHRDSRPCLSKGWLRVPLSLTDSQRNSPAPKLVISGTLLLRMSCSMWT
ncbi:hypothetical protein CRG98_009350 [Punica granatum]|uniref:Uncharacterized protein n=1 Tax=Punica granatum TaxID=22663 RepID=A0A2I0KPQ0_PUNGR|nr:hypothetical protein CRG98_009350 [Punica granatum]